MFLRFYFQNKIQNPIFARFPLSLTKANWQQLPLLLQECTFVQHFFFFEFIVTLKK